MTARAIAAAPGRTSLVAEDLGDNGRIFDGGSAQPSAPKCYRVACSGSGAEQPVGIDDVFPRGA
ncbi:MAG: hypothetical protein ACREX9_00390, partial [Gammaproteobacteria bacterium]